MPKNKKTRIPDEESRVGCKVCGTFPTLVRSGEKCRFECSFCKSKDEHKYKKTPFHPSALEANKHWEKEQLS